MLIFRCTEIQYMYLYNTELVLYYFILTSYEMYDVLKKILEHITTK